MCQIFAGQPPGNYRQVTRSFRLHGHSTSVRLEAKFWEMVDEIAASPAWIRWCFVIRSSVPARWPGNGRIGLLRHRRRRRELGLCWNSMHW